MVLAHLDAAIWRGLRRRGVPVGAEGLGEPGRAIALVRCTGDRCRVAGFEFSGAMAGEIQHGSTSDSFRHESKGAHRDVVIRLIEGITTGLGHCVRPGRSTSAPGERGPEGRALDRLDEAGPHERVDVPTDRGGTELQLGSQSAHGGRAPLQEGSRDPSRGSRHGFHNPHVTYFGRNAQLGARRGRVDRTS